MLDIAPKAPRNQLRRREPVLTPSLPANKELVDTSFAGERGRPPSRGVLQWRNRDEVVGRAGALQHFQPGRRARSIGASTCQRARHRSRRYLRVPLALSQLSIVGSVGTKVGWRSQCHHLFDGLVSRVRAPRVEYTLRAWNGGSYAGASSLVERQRPSLGLPEPRRN
eukprot:scaffold49364_cov44-Tisochrysis_lutea.AAC.2